MFFFSCRVSRNKTEFGANLSRVLAKEPTRGQAQFVFADWMSKSNLVELWENTMNNKAALLIRVALDRNMCKLSPEDGNLGCYEFEESNDRNTYYDGTFVCKFRSSLGRSTVFYGITCWTGSCGAMMQTLNL